MGWPKDRLNPRLALKYLVDPKIVIKIDNISLIQT